MSREKLEIAKADLIRNKPFYGYLLSRFKVVHDTTLPAGLAVALNNRGTPLLYYNEKEWTTLDRDFIEEIRAHPKKYTPEQIKAKRRPWTHAELCAALEHECLHIVHMHPIRMGDRKALAHTAGGPVSVWNISGDEAINQMIHNLPPTCIDYRDYKHPADSTAEIYYDLHVKNMKPMGCPVCGHQGNKKDEKQDGQDQSGQGNTPQQQEGEQGPSGAGSESGQDGSQKANGGKGGKPHPSSATGDGAGDALKQPFEGSDGHEHSSDGQGGGSDHQGPNEVKHNPDSHGATCPNCGSHSTLDDHGFWGSSDVDPELQREKYRQLVGQTYQKVGGREGTKGRGYLPGAVIEAIEDCLKKPYDWRPIFRHFCQGVIESDWRSTRFRPHRRYGDQFPGQKITYQGTIGVLVDTSGSVGTEELQQFYTELKAMAQMVEVTVIECDAAIHDIYKFDRRRTPEFKGRGGTDFQDVMDLFGAEGRNNPKLPEHLLGKERMLRQVEALVVLTDGGCGRPTPPRGVPVLWAITSDGIKPNVDYGEVIWLGKTEEDPKE